MTIEAFIVTAQEFGNKDDGTVWTEIKKETGQEDHELEGWWWWSCEPGCLPDGDPNGPFETEDEALADALSVDEDDLEQIRAYSDLMGYGIEEAAQYIEDAFRGEWDSLEDYAHALVNDCYDLERTMGSLALYFDYASFARDLEIGGDVSTHDTGRGTVFVFDNRA